ncbi:MAG TPA: B12-binding domain-containing protein [Methanomassiliicoccales archaeon]|nr:B12-binding domain-containing protein [Methanomassiliicoccales archaeon]HQM67394.1 B12-binding domain-containing protein [Methanomassiliicoccales archaeon]
MDGKAILDGLEKAVISGNKNDAVKYAKDALTAGVKALDAIDNGLVKGMTIVGDKYAKHEYFLPQVLLAANAMYGGLDILLPHIPKADAAKKVVGVIGVVEGDVHDIGKNIVKTMLTAAGLDMHDFGKDVPIENFVNSVKNQKANLIAMSTLMTPTMDGMKAVVDGLIENGDRMKVKIIIGGAPTSQAFADDIGADMHAINAQEAVKKVKEVL